MITDREKRLMRGRLEDWGIRRYDNGYFLTGYIFEDKKGQFADGTCIDTSYLCEIDFIRKIAITRNSIYILGEREE